MTSSILVRCSPSVSTSPKIRARPSFPTFPSLRAWLGAGLFTLAAAAIAPGAQAAIAVTDDTGATVTLAAPAQRIVSLAPHATELLFAAGAGDRVVGAVAYSDYPEAARRIPRVGDNSALDLERILALKPDLLVVWMHGNSHRQVEALRQLKLPVFYSEPKHLTDLPDAIERIGTLAGTPAKAHASADAFRARYEALRRQYASRAPVTVFYQVWTQPLMTLNGTHMVSDVIRLCGGVNVFADEAPLVPRVSVEAVLAKRPEAMFTATPGATQSDKPLATLDTWRKWPQLPAVAHNNLFGIDGDLINRPGPRILDGARVMCEDLDVARSRRTPAAAR
ncbi:cobalamin-binding protein [Pandoraea nosoerga]|uniref:Cobalamin-binding protein n=1 Tax=Pandoraea nosoerga TaxID=2508296 RepID=A0A5E4W4F8_9BURK|nr:cobalamin-binding protein [Pandoraea nosoerga]MBN4667751.1 cobalamin-binding protein [Pandoraea nosoerga]MBN4677648.1 cobalamin-binding protein [Pandoraea nosoerga]MBN4682570.1 cobalamin-binding protein [Pandoraea nosoerga]MBN4744985.1 cobalamin-binding protein [Pandoraea nosoerga]VVE19582.1 cobalamin-binding protein [Pandoraea nosoerga]